MEVLDIELRPQGIQSYTVHPGVIATGLTGREGTVDTEEGKAMMAHMRSLAPDTVELAADTIVALAVLGTGGENGDERVKVLSGRYYDSTWDLEKIIAQGEDILNKDLLRVKENGVTSP